MLKKMSVETRQQIRLLAKMQEAEAMRSMTPEQHAQETVQSMTVPRGFETRQDFYSNGSYAVDAARALAVLTGYKFRILNSDQGQKIPVNISVKDAPLDEALRELGAETGQLAKIHVDEAANLITFEYKSPAKSEDQW